MGEAARRRKLQPIGSPIERPNEATGETQEARFAGSPTTWLRQTRRRLEGTNDFARRADVPCNGCKACCYTHKVHVLPARERPEDLRHMNIVPDPNPDTGRGETGHMLAKREDGACSHLGPDGCSIYAHRPAACREFDCRTAAVIGMRFDFSAGKDKAPAGVAPVDMDRVAPLWEFHPVTEDDKQLHIALQYGAAVFARQHEGESWSLIDAFSYSCEMLKENCRMLKDYKLDEKTGRFAVRRRMAAASSDGSSGP
jgi:hypothetical protein